MTRPDRAVRPRVRPRAPLQ